MAKRGGNSSQANHDASSVLVDLPKQNKFFSESEDTLNEEPKEPSKVHWLAIIFGVVLTILIGISIVSWWYVSAFESASGVSTSEMISHVREGLAYNPFNADGEMTILLLGVDDVQNRQEGTLLTDTMMLVHVRDNGTVTLLSIPRDLWIDALKTKVNALYYYGEENPDTTGADLTKSVIRDISGLSIDYVMLVTMDSLKQFIDAVGGIEVYVESGFTDDKFPRDDVDISASDPSILYETVTFSQGIQYFDGDKALKYIRSRKSEAENEGNDLARTVRQQQVFNQLLASIQTEKVITNPHILGSLYKIWLEDIDTDASEEVLIGAARRMIGSTVVIRNIHIPFAEGEKTRILVVPDISKHGQWVFEPIDPTWQQLKTWVQTQID